MPGRVRLRLKWLSEDEAGASALAEALGRMEGIARVTVRPFTGSVLVEFDPEQVDAEHVLQAVTTLTGIVHHVHGEEPDPDEIAGYARIAATEGALLARTVVRAFRGLNVDLLQATGGRMDLGFAITLGFFTMGVAQLIRQRRVPAPPWFNLGWWAFRTFTEVEKKAINSPHSHILQPPPTEPYVGPERRHATSRTA